MLNRNEKGSLVFRQLDFSVFIGEMFDKCKTEKEVNWLQEQLSETIECSAEERLDEIDEE